METRGVCVPLRGTNMAAGNQHVYGFSDLCVNLSLEKLIKIEVIFIPKEEMLE